MNRPQSAFAALLLTIVGVVPAPAEQASFTSLPLAAIAEGQLSARHPASLVDIGSLTLDSDFTVFMRKDVPEDVRRGALRRLWVLIELPVSCHDLCYEPHPEAELFASHEPRGTVAAR